MNETNQTETNIEDIGQADPADEANFTDETPKDTAPAADREAELTNKLIRLQADFDNFRKRSLAGRAEARDEARREILLGLLPVYDNFLRALEHAEEVEDYGSLRTGIEGILQQMREFFGRNNCHEIDSCPGTAFDPNHHEAVGMVPGDADNNHTVAQEVQKGFQLNGNILRPAKVLVYAEQ